MALSFQKSFNEILKDTSYPYKSLRCWCICWSLHFDCCLRSIVLHHMSNEWHFVSFEFEPLLFQLDEFCSTTLLFYYDWNLCSGRKLCSSCLRSNYSTSLRLSMAEKGKPEWMSMASVPIHVISWKTWPRNGTVEVKICRGVWGLELMRYCCYLVGTSYFSLSYLSPFLRPKSA